jgi:thioredoxin 1
MFPAWAPSRPARLPTHVSEAHLVELQTPDDVEGVMAENSGAVVIDFWSSTCGPCLAMAPEFDAVARRYANEPIRFCKVQTDAHPELAAPFHIRSVPTLIFALDGEIVDAAVGRMNEQRLTKKVDWLLGRQRGDGFFTRLFSR